MKDYLTIITKSSCCNVPKSGFVRGIYTEHVDHRSLG